MKGLDTFRTERAAEARVIGAIRTQVVSRLAVLGRKRLPSRVNAARVDELRQVLALIDGPHGAVMEEGSELERLRAARDAHLAICQGVGQ